MTNAFFELHSCRPCSYAPNPHTACDLDLLEAICFAQALLAHRQEIGGIHRQSHMICRSPDARVLAFNADGSYSALFKTSPLLIFDKVMVGPRLRSSRACTCRTDHNWSSSSRYSKTWLDTLAQASWADRMRALLAATAVYTKQCRSYETRELVSGPSEAGRTGSDSQDAKR